LQPLCWRIPPFRARASVTAAKERPSGNPAARRLSLTTELPFAGYPTLGTARAWLDAGRVPRTPGRVVQECGAGLVPVKIDDDTLAFAAPPLIRSGPVDDADLAVALSILGVTPADVVEAEWIDNGPGLARCALATVTGNVEV